MFFFLIHAYLPISETICDVLQVTSGESSPPYRLLTDTFSFRVKASTNVTLILATKASQSAARYEIELNSDDGAATVLRRGDSGGSATLLTRRSTPGVLSNASFRAFWLDLQNGQFVLGSGETVIFFWRSDPPLDVKYAFFKSSNSNATFEICGRVGKSRTFFLIDV